tara:strand:- start:2785 stop:3762 length:978 start_codon:yes stop_codon:yes gene_type:complete
MIFGIKSAVLLSVSISFLIFLFVILSYNYEISDGTFVSRIPDIIAPKEFYSNHDSDEKKIFVIGSSQVVAINATRIDNYLSINGYDYDVYNLAQISDTPIKRLETLDMIISSNPEIIAYGIGPRDFRSSPTDNVGNPLPDPRDFFISFLNKYKNSFGFDASLLEFPQRSTLSYITDLVRTAEGKSDIIPYDNTPFMTVTTAATIINNNMGSTGLIYSNLNPPREISNYSAFEEIIFTLQENDIEVIIFVAPQSKFELANLSDDFIHSFNLILDEIYEIPNLKTYDLFYTYSDLNIWNDATHVAINNKTTIYTEDVAKMILEEIDQ